jgi:GNAT superfamily N-acetyltransferase
MGEDMANQMRTGPIDDPPVVADVPSEPTIPTVVPATGRGRLSVRARVAARVPFQYLIEGGSRLRRRIQPVRDGFHDDEIVVRPMRRERMSAVRRLELRLWLGGKLHWREDWVEFDWHVVAEIDHRRLAHVGVADRVATFDGVPTPIGLIGGVYTDRLFRLRGIASRLMRAAEADLAARGKTHGLLMCGEHLQGFYERLGWERVNGPLQFDWGWGPQLDVGCTMVRRLTDDAVLPEGLIDLHGQPA